MSDKESDFIKSIGNAIAGATGTPSSYNYEPGVKYGARFDSPPYLYSRTALARSHAYANHNPDPNQVDELLVSATKPPDLPKPTLILTLTLILTKPPNC